MYILFLAGRYMLVASDIQNTEKNKVRINKTLTTKAESKSFCCCLTFLHRIALLGPVKLHGISCTNK